MLAAAVKAAIQAKAPRRTVQAVAAAVASVVIRPDAAVPRSDPKARAGTQSEAQHDDGDPAGLLASLRAARAAQRKRKKERRRAAKQAAAQTVPSASETKDGAAGQHCDIGESAIAEPALAPVPGPDAAMLPPPQPPVLHETTSLPDSVGDSVLPRISNTSGKVVMSSRPYASSQQSSAGDTAEPKRCYKECNPGASSSPATKQKRPGRNKDGTGA